MKQGSNRLRELDFLRGVAIIGVLFRHQNVNFYTTNMGWIGIDLFFVLSGFFVSGLFFREYLKYGSIRPVRFLIRRGFKIYPVYYLTYPLYLIPIFWDNHFKIIGLLSDLLFVQNYVWGWGYGYAASWSLAVEEHFYFGLAIVLWLVLKKRWVALNVTGNSGFSSVEKIIFTIMALCLCARIASNLVFPDQLVRNFSMTHLRIDSLLTGVLISYLYYFRNEYLKNFFSKYRTIFYIIPFAGILWCPFIEPVLSVFAKTIGFTILYISFGAMLVSFLYVADMNSRLNAVFSTPAVHAISKIGYCSYSIYVIHEFVNEMTGRVIFLYDNEYFDFAVTSVISIGLGIVMTYTIEKFFLALRDKYYPAAVSSATSTNHSI